MKKIFIITMLLTASFTSYSANLTEITPDHAYPGETLTVTITGAGTHFMQASQTTVRLSNYSSSPTTIYPNSIDIISDEMLNAEFSIPTNFDYYSDGFYDVRVYTDIDGYMYLYDGFYITTPEILSIFPGTGDAGQTVPVTVTGQYTHFSDAGNNIVWLYNSQGSPSTIYGTNTSVQNNTTLQTEFSLPLDAHSGYWYLRIQNDIDGTISKSNAFDINGAEIVTISPDNANIGETIQVSITGSNTHFEQSTGLAVSLTNFQGSSTTIYGSGINITDDTFLETEFTIPINWGGYSGSGYCDVRVSNSIDGNITSGDGFYIHGSEILSITPNSAVAGDILQVTIAGQNTHFSDAGNNTVWLYNYQGSTTTIYGTNTSAQSNTALQTWFSIPFDAYSGSWHLKIQNDINGTISKSYAFDISGPEITGISPASANAGEPVQVSITGQNTYFEQSGGTTVWLSSYQASSTTIYGSNINIINDFSLETTFDIPISASVGYWNLNVANSIIGTLTETYAFYITALSPELVAIYPDHADAGESLQVTITGQYTNFTQSSGTTVRLSNYQASPTYLYGTNINIVDNETIEANLSIPVTWVDHDYCDVRIYTDNYGYLYLYSGFQVNMPEIISLSADSAGAGDTLSFIITGNNTHFNQAGYNTAILYLNNKGTTLITGTIVTVYDDISLLVEFIIPTDAESGYWNVEIQNIIDGTITLENSFFISNSTFVIEHDDSRIFFVVYPNPASENCIVEYELTGKSYVMVAMYSITSEKVFTTDNKVQSPGRYTWEFYPPGQKLSDGLYFIELSVNDEKHFRKIIIRK